MELGKKIRQLRFKAGLTQEQLAEKLGIGAQSVSKWENAATMPDITALPLLAEVFGVSIDELFDLTNEQRLNRIENSLDIEEDLPQELFREYEDFLKGQLADAANRKRATDLIAYLYWHRMNSCAKKAGRYAKDSVRMDPDEKVSQWILSKTDGHAVWDWNISNHSRAVDFWRGVTEEHPGSRLSYLYLLDNLIADHRTEEAEKALERMSRLQDSDPVMEQVYRAHIALARFDEPSADRIIEELIKEYPDNSACLFETAQYYAEKCDYARAIGLYEKSFETDPRRPRFQDALMAIADLYEIMGEPRKAAETLDRIIDLLENEWGLTDDVALKEAQAEKARLLARPEK